MASFSTTNSDGDSDFGYDFTPEDEQSLLQLGSNLTPLQAPSAVTNAVDTVPGRTATATNYDLGDSKPLDIRAYTCLNDSGQGAVAPEVASRGLLSSAALGEDISGPNLSETLPKDEAIVGSGRDATEIGESDQEDERSPLQRFRSYPRKPLTVTDLTSGSWCELQYWYTLTRLPGGRRTRTAAMKQGTKVHKKLEDEVHTTVRVEVTTKEDWFGLKLWNFVQGLRTLRETGLTRELEVWGTVDGNLVNGVIDELSHENPNPEFEAELSSQELQHDKLSQSALTDYFPPKTKTHKGKKVYLADVKTRGTLKPVSAALLRPAKIQLLLYHHFLADMASDKLDFFQVFRRYGLNADATFSDAFLAQISGLHDEIFVDAPESEREQSPIMEQQSSHLDEVHELQKDLLKYQSLRELVVLVKEELQLTFPAGAESIGHMLNIKYVYREDGREIDTHDFPHSDAAMKDYLSHYMPWWRGERKADGVQIEEAFKCRTCEFVEDCTWRQEMDAERVANARRRVTLRKSVV
ncbi:exonuclease V - a 5' deoxyribonuclease domain-containing protein [Sarocladium implicatum]|nr:exonuclease V - a 5' deoxyribonuclease domain-containing protein [Sarocladium implicatum]